MPNSTGHIPESIQSDESDLTTISFAVRTLITIAERRKGVDSGRCRIALLHFESATLIHRSLRRVLARHKLSDLQFAVLVILFSTEPEPLTASVLAEHAGVSRSAMTDAVDKLEAVGCLTRSRDAVDRRVTYLRITAAGQDAIDCAINDYLRAAEDAVRQLRTSAQRILLSTYIELLRTLADHSEPLSDASTL